MNALIIGQGGREHALAWKCLQSQACDEAYVLPGNAGMARTANLHCLDESKPTADTIERIVQMHAIDLVIIGPEKELAEGLVDALEAKRICVLGPSQAASRLESSKIFAKQFMQRQQIPTADCNICYNYEEAIKALNAWQHAALPVIKLDGLAAGKGVFLPETREEAETILFNIYQDRDYPLTADKILLEQRVSGHEVSVFALCDGERFQILGAACDHKRLLDGNKGPNTGGMGAYTPEAISDSITLETIAERVIAPTLRGMQAEGTPFKGFLFAGLMVEADTLNVLEFNVRMGDPETQTLLPILGDDFFERCLQATRGALKQTPHEYGTQRAVHVVMASGGYPGLDGPLSLGYEILGLDQLPNDVHCFAAGIARNEHGKLINSGGRVLGITAVADDLETARTQAYAAIDRLHFEDRIYRKDIAASVS